MLRRTLKNTTKHKKLKELVAKYKIPKEYLSTNRRMISKGILIGLFIAFIPMPFQMVAVLCFMPFVKFNVPIGLLMCWVTNPFTMPIIYYVEYLTGSFLLNIKLKQVSITLEWFTANIDDIFIPLYSGALFYSIVLSVLSYILVNFFWKLSVYKDRNHK